MKINCRFDDSTGIGKGTGAAQDGEFNAALNYQDIAWFIHTPSRYQLIDGVFSEIEGWLSQNVSAFVVKVLNEAKEKKITAIMTSFNTESKKPVNVGGWLFDGGWTSLDKLDRAITFAKKMGIAERYFYETDETPHLLPLEGQGLTGEAILVSIALAYDALDTKMRVMVKAVNSATTVQAVDSIQIDWS